MPAITAMAMRIRVAKIGDKPLVLLRNFVIFIFLLHLPLPWFLCFITTFDQFAYKTPYFCWEYYSSRQNFKLKCKLGSAFSSRIENYSSMDTLFRRYCV